LFVWFSCFSLLCLVNAPVKEEQLSEAWSLDVDPPESVINEPINDDDQISSLSAFLRSNSRSIQQTFVSSSVPLINVSSSYNSNTEMQFLVRLLFFFISLLIIAIENKIIY
jgi:hypothetical protein